MKRNLFAFAAAVLCVAGGARAQEYWDVDPWADPSDLSTTDAWSAWDAEPVEPWPDYGVGAEDVYDPYDLWAPPETDWYGHEAMDLNQAPDVLGVGAFDDWSHLDIADGYGSEMSDYQPPQHSGW